MELLTSRQPADIAQAIAEHEEHALQILLSLPMEKAARTLYKLEPVLREAVVQDLARNSRFPTLLQTLDADEVADLLAELPEAQVQGALAQLPQREDVLRLLDYPADSAGGIMDTAVLTVADTDTATEARQKLRERAEDLERQSEAYVVDDAGHLRGTVRLWPLFVSAIKDDITNIMQREPESVVASMDREDVVNRMERYDLEVMPVVDDEGRLLGRVTLTDAISVMREESDEDLRYMGGLIQPSSTAGRVMRLVQSRLPWLALGMIGSMLGALVILRFEGALEQAAILAAFIPLIAATAGNAGIQSSTVTVQGLATGTIDLAGLLPRLLRELGGAMLNGLAVSLLLAVFLSLFQWLLPDRLGGGSPLLMTLAISLIAVISVASLIGAAVPVALKRLGVDPAVATGPFITVSNDIIGVWVYFMVASWLYL